ncbi:hypothetical protein ACVBEQ_09900 [Nakamurella sp. GG22]
MNDRSWGRTGSFGLIVLVAGLAVAACTDSTATSTPQVSTATSPSATAETASNSPQISTRTSLALTASKSIKTNSSGETSVATSASSTSAPIGSSQTLSFATQDKPIEVTVTVHGYAPFTSDNRLEQPDANTLTVALDAEVCTSVANTVQSEDRWVLVDSNNGRYQPEVSMVGVPKPEYPYFSEKLTAGECIRGYIPFTIPSDAKITTIRYATENGFTLRWSNQ